MKIKVLLAVVILSTLALTQVHGFGIGAQFNYRAGGIFGPGASFVFSPSRSFHIAANWYAVGNKVNDVGLSFDWRLLNIGLVNFGVGSLNFTLDAGAYTNFKISSNGLDNFTGGARLPVGLSLLLLGNILEVYTHVAPSIGVWFTPKFALDEPFFPIAVGGRVWLF